MKLATLRLNGPDGQRTVAARVDGDFAVELEGFDDVGDLLRRGSLADAATATGAAHELSAVELAPVVTRPGKIFCVGLNYRKHIEEMGRGLPEHPTLFAKFAEAIIGPSDQIVLPPESDEVDWEGELTIVVGKTVRRARGDDARAAIAGYTVLNDVTMRDYQYRTTQWFQGKTWEATTPLGPFLATPDEIPEGAQLVTSVDGEEVQRTRIDDLLFDPVTLIEYISTMITLHPGDIIATGTPGGVGHARKPARYLTAGQTLRTSIDGIGELVNVTVADTGVALAAAAHAGLAPDAPELR